jgi:plasmid stability protein
VVSEGVSISAYMRCYHVGMKVQAGSIQYTIRGVPREVDRALRQKAARRKRSLNQVILEELTEATIGGRQKADFSDVTGRWTPDAAFDKIMAAQRQIDWDKWK